MKNRKEMLFHSFKGQLMKKTILRLAGGLQVALSMELKLSKIK
jgi:hypothetical protein